MKTLEEDPLVYIVIVTWNSIRQLEYCLPTVTGTTYSNYRILVVDNHSGDGSIDYVRKNFPQIEVIENRKNRGYAGGNNDGIRYALASGARFIAIINPDVKVDHRWLSVAVKTAQADRSVGILGFNVIGEHSYTVDKDEQFETAKAKYNGPIVSEVSSNTVLCGMALFCRSSMFEAIGLFDEVYFCYAEESDLESRAKRAGYKMVRTNVPVWHEGEGSSKRIPFKKSYLAMRNTIRYTLKNCSPAGMAAMSKYMLRISCSRTKPDMSLFHHRRLRPSENICFNLAFLCAAIIWNILNLPETMISRAAADRKISGAKGAGGGALFSMDNSIDLRKAIIRLISKLSSAILRLINRLSSIAIIRIFKMRLALKNRLDTNHSTFQKDAKRKKHLNILLINNKWDCAGVSISLCNAINRHTKHRARHMVAVETAIKYETDITSANCVPHRLWSIMKIIEKADILHFNYADHSVPFFDIRWPDFMRGKKCIFHDHSGWEPRKLLHNAYVSGRLFHKYDDYEQAIVCAPSDTHIFNRSIWLPNLMPIYREDYLPLRDRPHYNSIIIGQTASSPELKSTEMLADAVRELKAKGYNVEMDLITGASHSDCLRRKRSHYIEFDNMHQGHHGMAGLEAISMGIPTLAWLTPEVIKAYERLGSGDPIPFINVRDKGELMTEMIELITNRNTWEERSSYSRRWIEKYYDEKNLVQMYIDLFERLMDS